MLNFKAIFVFCISLMVINTNYSVQEKKKSKKHTREIKKLFTFQKYFETEPQSSEEYYRLLLELKESIIKMGALTDALKKYQKQLTEIPEQEKTLKDIWGDYISFNNDTLTLVCLNACENAETLALYLKYLKQLEQKGVEHTLVYFKMLSEMDYANKEVKKRAEDLWLVCKYFIDQENLTYLSDSIMNEFDNQVKNNKKFSDLAYKDFYKVFHITFSTLRTQKKFNPNITEIYEQIYKPLSVDQLIKLIEVYTKNSKKSQQQFIEKIDKHIEEFQQEEDINKQEIKEVIEEQNTKEEIKEKEIQEEDINKQEIKEVIEEQDTKKEIKEEEIKKELKEQKYPYTHVHPRVELWWTNPQERMSQEKKYANLGKNTKEKIILFHTLPQEIDTLMDLFIIKKNPIKKIVEYNMPMVLTTQQKKYAGIYTLCVKKEENGNEVLYHRCFTEKPTGDEIFNELCAKKINSLYPEIGSDEQITKFKYDKKNSSKNLIIEESFLCKKLTDTEKKVIVEIPKL